MVLRVPRPYLLHLHLHGDGLGDHFLHLDRLHSDQSHGLEGAKVRPLRVKCT